MEQSHTSDADLVRRTLAGETRAFGDLVRRYQQAVYGLAYSRVGVFADAQDIAQEAFIRAFRSLRQLDDPARFAAWLNAITVNECRAWHRARARQVARDSALAEVEAREGREWERGELRTAVLQAVDALPEAGRLVVALRYLSGLSCAEIARFLDVPTQAVESRLYRARRRLKEEMTAMVEETLGERKLPQGFTEGVLRELSLTPDGFVTLAGLGTERRTLILGAPHGGKDLALVALTMHAPDGAAILTSPFDAADALPKGRGIDCATQVMGAFGIELERVVLRLEAEAQCRASAVMRKGRSSRSVDLRASDGLALASRLKAPIYAEDALIRQGKVGEDGLPCDVTESLEDLRDELVACHQSSLLTGKAFETGLSPEEGRTTVRYRRDERAGKLWVSVDGSAAGPLALDLAEWGPGFAMVWREASREAAGKSYSDGHEYTTSYRIDGDEVAMTFEPADGPR